MSSWPQKNLGGSPEAFTPVDATTNVSTNLCVWDPYERGDYPEFSQERRSLQTASGPEKPGFQHRHPDVQRGDTVTFDPSGPKAYSQDVTLPVNLVSHPIQYTHFHHPTATTAAGESVTLVSSEYHHFQPFDHAQHTQVPIYQQTQPSSSATASASNQKKSKVVSFKRKKCSSQFMGVLFVKDHNKWRAQICHEKKKYCVGSFKTEQEAALARDLRLVELFGPQQREVLNFPEKMPPEALLLAPPVKKRKRQSFPSLASPSPRNVSSQALHHSSIEPGGKHN